MDDVLWDIDCGINLLDNNVHICIIFCLASLIILKYATAIFLAKMY